MVKSKRRQLVLTMMLLIVSLVLTSFVGFAAPSSVDIVIDSSGSMSGDCLSLAKATAHGIVSTHLPDPNNKVAILSFNFNVFVEQAHTGLAGASHTAISGISAGGGTWIWNAAAEALEYQWPEYRHPGFGGYDKWVIILTDGFDGYNDPVSRAEVEQEAERHNKHFCVVNFSCLDKSRALKPEASAFKEAKVQLKLKDVNHELEKLARDTGGIYLNVTNKASAQEAGKRIVRLMLED